MMLGESELLEETTEADLLFIDSYDDDYDE